MISGISVTRSLSLLLTSCLLLSACDDIPGDPSDADSAGNPSDRSKSLILTSNYPLYFLATRITAGIDSAPQILLPEIEGDPAAWLPSAAQIRLLQEADLVLLNGAGAEPWLDLVTLRNQRLVDTTSEIPGQLIPLDENVVHQHGPEGEHSHHGTAFTTWLDPLLLMDQAGKIVKALTELDPQLGPHFEENMIMLEKELSGLHQRIGEALAPLADRPVLFSHPVYQYLERRYDLNGISLHWEPDIEPKLTDWLELQRILASGPVTIMIWEDEPLATTSSRLAELGLETIPWHTAANRPLQDDFMAVMQANATRLELVFRGINSLETGYKD